MKAEDLERRYDGSLKHPGDDPLKIDFPNRWSNWLSIGFVERIFVACFFFVGKRHVKNHFFVLRTWRPWDRDLQIWRSKKIRTWWRFPWHFLCMRSNGQGGQVFWKFFSLEKVTYYAAWLPSKVTKLVIGFAILTHYSTIRGNVCETMWIYIILNNFDTFFVTL